jgi:23S rRNA (uracil1939-C5)-methyltransferase
MAQGGRAFARVDGKVTFIDGALPGELVEVEILKRRKDFDEARVLRVLEPNPGRVDPPCPHYARCGGCNLQHAGIDLQRLIKRQVVNELFGRIAKIPLPSDWPLHGGEPLGYRRRARFVQGSRGWGFREEGSHAVEPVRSCPVLCSPLQKILETLPVLARDSEVQCFADSTEAVGIWNQDKPNSSLPIQIIKILGKPLQADARVFFQSNFEMAEVLVSAVRDELVHHPGAGKFSVDFFSGVGVFAAFLQDHFERVVAVEWNPGCLAHARKNLGSRCEFMSESAEEFLAGQIPQSLDFLVVDPPRSGLSPEVRQALLQARPRRMAYVSCDPATLARDVGEFVRNGWKLERLDGFDFYPQTDHLEMLAVLVPG